ncbi:hypothetical protein HT031_003548 [Scenedesmus sp. PABB004]|nr:hypothetical protein HT031_003548 [Scenedesmus sp. PABB004]
MAALALATAAARWGGGSAAAALLPTAGAALARLGWRGAAGGAAGGGSRQQRPAAAGGLGGGRRQLAPLGGLAAWGAPAAAPAPLLQRRSCAAVSSTPSAAAAAQPEAEATAQGSSAAEPPAAGFVNAAAPPPPPPPPGAAAGAPAAAAGAAAAAAAAASSVGGVLPGGAPLAEYTMRQVSKHASDDTCWIVVNGKVYDVTSYIDDHPGGSESILLNAGVDCTEEFMGVHSQEAKDLLKMFAIGTVKPGGKKAAAPAGAAAAAAAAARAAADPGAPPVALVDPRERVSLPLALKARLNHDTYFMRFALPTPAHTLGLPCGKHVFLCADIGGEAVVRAYTPVSGDRNAGVLDLLIKVYWGCPRFPEGGKMTQHLAAMKEGDTIDVKGPYGKFHYQGRGTYTLNRAPGVARYLSMVAGGSGVTPCYAVAREALADPADGTRLALIYANKHEEDIWLRDVRRRCPAGRSAGAAGAAARAQRGEPRRPTAAGPHTAPPARAQELDALAAAHPDRFHVWYVVEEPGTPPTPYAGQQQPAQQAAAAAAAALGQQQQRPGPWQFSRGFITPDMMAQHLLPPRPVGGDPGGALALMCGPPGMLEGVVVPGFTALGYAPEQMVAQKEGARCTVFSPSGETYRGTWHDHRRHGKGVLTYTNGDKYEGDFADGRRHGDGTLWVLRGGRYVLRYAGGWADDLPHGSGSFFDESGGVSYEGEFVRGLRHGRGRGVSGGDVYEGAWADDMRCADLARRARHQPRASQPQAAPNRAAAPRQRRHGTGTLMLANGDLYEGGWQADAKHGQGTFFHCAKGARFDGVWHEGTARCGAYSEVQPAPPGARGALPTCELAEPDAVLQEALQGAAG